MDAIDLLLTRESAMKLDAPAPSEADLDTMFQSAVRAPDHGRLRPWRFVVIEGDKRAALGNLMADAMRQREPDVSEDMLNRERAKPMRAPTIVVAAARVQKGHRIPECEQIASAAAATQNIMLAAHALGYGAMWKTGEPAYDAQVKTALGLNADDEIMGFLYLGTNTGDQFAGTQAVGEGPGDGLGWVTRMPDFTSIDCDIHPGVPEIKALLPYMSDFWRHSFVDRGIDGFDMMSYPLGAPITCRPDWRVPGERPGSSLTKMREQALDRFGIGMAICNPLTGGQVAVSESMGAAICSAVNDWIVEHWLNKEPRLRASIVVPAQAPMMAVEEIERLAHDKRFVQVMLPAACEMMLGRSYYWPIYEAAAKHGLPIGIHAGSMYRYAPTATGWPSHYLHDYITNSQLFEGQLLSLVSNGVFVKFPELKFVFIESGVSWLPHFIWRAIKTWRGVRAEVPWVKQSPAEIIRANIRVTTQPFDAPDQATVERIVDQIDCDEMFLFSSDYPHWQFEGDAVTPPGLSDALLQRMRVDNPLATYPRLKETVS